MGLLTSAFEERASSGPSVHPSRQDFLRALGIEPESAAGIRVDDRAALSMTHVWAAVNVISDAVAYLPIFVYERRPDDDRRKMPDHPMAYVLRQRPNRWQRPAEFRKTLTASTLMRGIGYAVIYRDAQRHPIELLPMHPDRVSAQLDDKDDLYYEISLRRGGIVRVPQHDMLVLRGLTFDGYTVVSPIKALMDALGAGIAVQQYAARFFRNSAQPVGILKTPKPIPPERRKELAADWRANYGGTGQHKTALLDEGWEFQKISIEPEAAQMIETRRLSIEDGARAFNIPPYKLQDYSQMKWSNIEAAAIDFVTNTVRPWLIQWEEALNDPKLSLVELGRFYVEFKMDALLRADTLTRYQAYALGRQWGWETINSIKRKENEDEIGPEGDISLAPLNMVNVQSMLAQQPEGVQRQLLLSHDEAQRRRQERFALLRRRLRLAHRGIFVDAMTRALIRDMRRLTIRARKAGRDNEATDWIDDYLRDEHAKLMATFRPAVETLDDAMRALALDELGVDDPGDDDALWIAALIVKRYGIRLREQVAAGEPDIAALAESWGGDESVFAANAALLDAWRGAGVHRIRWLQGPECDQALAACRALNGHIVAIGQPFVAAGEMVTAEDGASATPSVAIRHGPLAADCTCSIAPEVGEES